jgi:membrane protease YdiL (CAAX protease family)
MSAKAGTAWAQDAPPEQRDAPRRLPSRLVANLYLLIGIVLLIVNSTLDLDTLPTYLLSIALLVVLALLSLLFMRLERLDIRTTARLHRAERRDTLLALASVPSLWIAGIILNVISSVVFGYTSPVSPMMFPRNAWEAIALAVTTVVAAPVCEEIIFRGYVQRAYERSGIRSGIVFGGLIFALYHLRFQGVFALIPVALGLGFVVWRTGSVYPAMLMHAAYNAIATIILISTSFLSAQITGMVAIAFACTGILVAPLSLLALWKLRGRPLPEAVPARQAPPRIPFWVLPALALLAVYGFAAATELLVQRFPETVLDNPLVMNPPETWDAAVDWTYVVQNRLGRDLGNASCSRRPGEAEYVMACEADYIGFDIADELPGLGGQLEDFDWADLPFNIRGMDQLLRSAPQNWVFEASWAADVLELRTFDLEIFNAVAEDQTEQPVTVQFAAGEAGNGVVVRRPGEEARTLSVEGEPVLMLHEWAWRFGALPFELPFGGPVTVVEVDVAGDAAVYRGFLRVAGGEPAWTPAGNFIAWQLTMTWEDNAGQRHARSAWYDSDAPHTLLRYDDGVVSYVLESVGTVP